MRQLLIIVSSLLLAQMGLATALGGTKFATGWVSALPMATGTCNYVNLNDVDVDVQVTGLGGASTLGHDTFEDVAPHQSVSIAFTVPAYPVVDRSFFCKFEALASVPDTAPVAACNATARRPNGEQHAESDCQR